MRKGIKCISSVLLVASAVLFSVVGYVSGILPEDYLITQECPVSSISTDWITAGTAAGDQQVSVGDAPSTATLRLFGLIPIKEVRLESTEKKTVQICGTPFGVKMFTDGVVVVETNPIDTAEGRRDPGKEAGIMRGDVLTEVDGEKVTDTDHFSSLLQEREGEEVEITVVRSNMTFTVSLQPALDEADGKEKAGLWVRDSSAGIGTMTYYDPETKTFGGLGHGICDVDTGELLPLSTGEIVAVQLTGIVKGTSGAAGELRGKFSGAETIGTLTENSETGVFGTSDGDWVQGEEMTVALKQEVVQGACQIYTSIDETGPSYYDAQIIRIDYGSARTKNMVIQVTDPELLEKTGGIIQGMSGSPIVQNGKLVGAVTHVLVGDPTTGYGIFLENMLETTDADNQ